MKREIVYAALRGAPWGVAGVYLLFLLGGLTATAAEYLAALYHQKALGVSFWSYEGLPGNIQGRVCLPFSLAWGVLSLGLVYWLHPLLAPWLARIPDPVSFLAMATVSTDGLLTAALVGSILLKRERRAKAGIAKKTQEVTL